MKDGNTIQLIALLGNPDREHRGNRHNLPWMLDELLTAGPGIWNKKFLGESTSCTLGGEKRHLLKPHTYMNASGQSIQKALHFFKIPADSLLVVHDELELPFGTSEIRFGGGLGGHNGLKSVAQQLGSRDFWRMRMGIGRPPRGSVHSFVLSDFSNDEQEFLPHYLQDAYATLGDFLSAPHSRQYKKRKQHLPEN